MVISNDNGNILAFHCGTLLEDFQWCLEGGRKLYNKATFPDGAFPWTTIDNSGIQM